MSTVPLEQLTEAERDALQRGQHEQIATRLRARQRADLAGRVLEQIWAFQEALDCYLEAGELEPAVRVALETGRPDMLERTLQVVERQASDPQTVESIIRLLRERGRELEAARLLAHHGDPQQRAEALHRGGDVLGAARAVAQAGQARQALDWLTPLLQGEGHGAARALAAELSWDLGDAEACARFAQQALRAQHDPPELRTLLGRALASLGHELAAHIVLGDAPIEHRELPGRYRVTAILPAPIAGAAYMGIDRVTLEEVEIHLLLAEHPPEALADPEVTSALERFAAEAELGARTGHPAIRPILRLDPATGLLVLPRAAGPTLRSLIRPPGLETTPGRVRGLIAFLLEGLLAGQAHGLVHGSLLPSQIVSDPLGRPLLGPFGTHWLARLAATRTGTLEELLRVTAPELRGRGHPTHQGDIYALGVLMIALLRGTLEPVELGDDERPELALARAMTDPDPARRPSARRVLERLRAPVSDLREVGSPRPDDTETAWRIFDDSSSDEQDVGIAVVAGPGWTDEQLDLLCQTDNPWLQPVVDRDERRLVLAPWPSGSRVLDADEPDWRRLVPTEALQNLPDPLREAIETRLGPSSLVATPSGEWMIALDDLLSS